MKNIVVLLAVALISFTLFGCSNDVSSVESVPPEELAEENDTEVVEEEEIVELSAEEFGLVLSEPFPVYVGYTMFFLENQGDLPVENVLIQYEQYDESGEMYKETIVNPFYDSMYLFPGEKVPVQLTVSQSTDDFDIYIDSYETGTADTGLAILRNDDFSIESRDRVKQTFITKPYRVRKTDGDWSLFSIVVVGYENGEPIYWKTNNVSDNWEDVYGEGDDVRDYYIWYGSLSGEDVPEDDVPDAEYYFFDSWYE